MFWFKKMNEWDKVEGVLPQLINSKDKLSLGKLLSISFQHESRLQMRHCVGIINFWVYFWSVTKRQHRMLSSFTDSFWSLDLFHSWGIKQFICIIVSYMTQNAEFLGRQPDRSCKYKEKFRKKNPYGKVPILQNL